MNYRELLFHSLAKKDSGLKQDAINAIFERYDRAVSLRPANEKQIVESFLEQWGNESFSKAMQSFASINYSLPMTKNGETIHSALQEASKKTVEKTGLTRLRDLIKRYNQNISKCSCEVTTHRGTFQALSPEELKDLEMRIPRAQATKDALYSSWASYKETFGLN